MEFPGLLHRYNPQLTAFQHTPSPSNPSPQNTILFIAGLGEGFLSLNYVKQISTALPPTWSIVEVLLSSSHEGWRTGSLARDARELKQCVRYFKEKNKGGRIVLLGHSTGCQDIMEYLVGPTEEGEEEEGEAEYRVEGVILQGGVSDREATPASAERDALIAEAKRWIDDGRGEDVMPRKGHIMVGEGEPGVSAYRTYSLLAKGGDDDYFSSDLGDEVLRRTFGRMGKRTGRVMFALGGEDPYVAEWVDRNGLVERWTGFVKEGGGVVDEGNGGVVPGARHSMNDDGEEVVGDFVGRVVRFVEGVGREG